MYYVYVIYTQQADKLYIGQTADLNERLRSHNRKQGNHYTAKFEGEWKLVHSEPVTTRSEALRREKQLKSSRSRAYIKQLINNLDIPG